MQFGGGLAGRRYRLGREVYVDSILQAKGAFERSRPLYLYTVVCMHEDFFGMRRGLVAPCLA